MKSPHLSTGPVQLPLPLDIAVEREIEGVGIVRITAAWQDSPLKIREIVRAQGADDSIAFIALEKNGTIHHAVPAAAAKALEAFKPKRIARR